MKTASEWVNQLPPDVLDHPMPFPARLDYAAKIVKRIQLDAWKEGMKDAGKIIELLPIIRQDGNQSSELIKAALREAYLAIYNEREHRNGV